ncbi:hypothetical protein DFS34DRAFT_594393 [Phlyctochytrium arcticum]|nr:hypothetical protein DFS34DRAFT_594393 [Phlyctochytrium arcticum]
MPPMPTITWVALALKMPTITWVALALKMPIVTLGGIGTEDDTKNAGQSRGSYTKIFPERRYLRLHHKCVPLKTKLLPLADGCKCCFSYGLTHAMNERQNVLLRVRAKLTVMDGGPSGRGRNFAGSGWAIWDNPDAWCVLLSSSV